MYISLSLYIYIYIYIEGERERERERERYGKRDSIHHHLLGVTFGTATARFETKASIQIVLGIIVLLRV